MPYSKFTCEVLTPEGEVFNDEVEMVSTRTTIGELGVLANMAPLLGMLDPTELRLYKSDTEIVRFAQSEGYIQVGGNHVIVLVEEAIPPESLDQADLRDKLAETERELDSAGDDTEKRRVTAREKRRLEQFLKIAGSGS
jgi:F-type H+-transporting ATPase subunit epsilon